MPFSCNNLTVIANENKTDKGTLHFEAHGYTEVYGKLISSTLPINLLEIGVWHGDSIRMWNQYNKKINLYAIDFDPNVRNYFTGEEIVKLYISDQKNENTINRIFQSAGNFDFIVDDGSHNYLDILESFKLIYPKLKQNAIYFIEDLHAGHAQKDNLIQDLNHFIESNNLPISKTEFFCNDKLVAFFK
jgi:predicted O-methyltransferase YrrM